MSSGVIKKRIDNAKTSSNKKGESAKSNVNSKVPTKVIEKVVEVKQEITADDIVDTMKSVENSIKNFSIDTLIDTKELLEKKSSDYGPVATVLDLLGEVTGYAQCNVPLGESAALTRLITKIVRYMSLRGASKINFEALTDTTKDLVGECTRLHTMCSFNQPVNKE